MIFIKKKFKKIKIKKMLAMALRNFRNFSSHRILIPSGCYNRKMDNDENCEFVLNNNLLFVNSALSRLQKFDTKISGSPSKELSYAIERKHVLSFPLYTPIANVVADLRFTQNRHFAAFENKRHYIHNNFSYNNSVQIIKKHAEIYQHLSPSIRDLCAFLYKCQDMPNKQSLAIQIVGTDKEKDVQFLFHAYQTRSELNYLWCEFTTNKV